MAGDREAKVRSWHAERLRLLGFGELEITALLDAGPVDVHAIEKLVKAGCPLGLAARIEWPLPPRRSPSP